MSKKVGRPKIEIDFENLQKMCEIHCTQEEICHLLDINHETLDARLKEAGFNNFSHYYKKASTLGKKSLRRIQFEAANNGSVPMMIWLGKQYLGQTDKQEMDMTTRDVTPLQVEFIDKV